jgi:hypothetical protein
VIALSINLFSVNRSSGCHQETVFPCEFLIWRSAGAKSEVTAGGYRRDDHRTTVGAFEPASFRDRYQDALCDLVEAKTKGLVTTPRAIAEPAKVTI